MWAKINKRATIDYQNQDQKSESQISSQNSGDQLQKQSGEKLKQYQQNKSSKKYSYSDSQSDDQSSSQQDKSNQKLKRNARQSISSNSEQDDSLDNSSYIKNKRLQPLRQQSNQEEQSIDYIEERIRKLERDLEDRLDKHKSKIKQNGSSKTKYLQHQKAKDQSSLNQASGKIVSVRKQPPVPPKKKQVQQNSSSLPQTQINFKSKQKSNQIERNQNQRRDQRQEENFLQKKKQVKQNNPELMNIRKQKSSINSPTKVGKKKSKDASKNTKSQIQLGKAPSISEDFKKLNKQINQLRKQNKNLKQELTYFKKKKKPVQELVKLKQLSQHDTKKLQKQFQLLKVLQKLQNKLKNSIQRKLGKGSSDNKQIKQTALLHKGLPSNILN